MREDTQKRLGWFLFFLSVAFLLGYLGKNVLSLAALQQKSMALKNLVETYYVQTVLVYIGVYALIITLALPLVIPYALVGGFMFGTYWATLYSLIGIELGMLGAFFFIRVVLLDFVQKRFATHLLRFKWAMQRYGANYMLLLYWSAVVPSFVIASLAAVADISRVTYMWTAIVGNLPLVFICSMAGRQLGKIKAAGQIFSPQLIGLLALLMVLALFPIIMRRVQRLLDAMDR